MDFFLLCLFLFLVFPVKNAIRPLHRAHLEDLILRREGRLLSVRWIDTSLSDDLAAGGQECELRYRDSDGLEHHVTCCIGFFSGARFRGDHVVPSADLEPVAVQA